MPYLYDCLCVTGIDRVNDNFQKIFNHQIKIVLMLSLNVLVLYIEIVLYANIILLL